LVKVEKKKEGKKKKIEGRNAPKQGGERKI